MLIDKLITLTEPFASEWELLAGNVLGKDVHADRKNGFILSRMALLSALEEAGVRASPKEMILTDYSQLKQYPQFTVSLSHTKGFGASLIADKKTYLSVGIDIEQEARPVKDMIIERISNPGDLRLRNIELWCLKEAAFKALMNTGKFQLPLGFSSLCIGDKVWTHSPSGTSGKWELGRINSILMAKAFLLN